MVTVLLDSEVLLGILEETSMLSEMGNLMLTNIPSDVGKAFDLIIGFMAVLIAVMFGTDAYFFGILPLVTEVRVYFGVSELSSALMLLIGHNSTVLAFSGNRC